MVNIYVLKLEDNKFYIGKTNNDVNNMYNQHKNNTDCEWTTKYPPIELVNKMSSEYSLDEDKLTKCYMKKYGIENVRGGSYSKVELDDSVIKSLEHEFSLNQDITVGDIYSEDFKELYAQVDDVHQLLEIFQQQMNLAKDMWCLPFDKAHLKYQNNKIKELDTKLHMIDIKKHARKLKYVNLSTIGTPANDSH